MSDYQFSGRLGKTYAFDPEKLESSANSLKKQFQDNPDALIAQMTETLIPPDALGQIPHSSHVLDALGEFVTTTREDARKLGINVFELAARSVAAANLAYEADLQTQSIAHHTQ